MQDQIHEADYPWGRTKLWVHHQGTSDRRVVAYDRLQYVFFAESDLRSTTVNKDPAAGQGFRAAQPLLQHWRGPSGLASR
jgi:hypothetical protein